MGAQQQAIADTGETRILFRDARPAPSPPVPRTTTPEEAQVDALRADEIGRLNVFSRLMILLTAIGAPLIPLLGGDPLAELIVLGAVAIIAATYVYLYWTSTRADRYSDAAVAWISQIQSTVAHGATYFFGVFSPFPAILAVGIYVYSLGSRANHSLLSFLNVATGHALLAGLIVGGVIADRGIIHGDYLDARQQIIVVACIEIVYGLAFLLGRMSRHRTVQSLADLERAIRELAQREALLTEARQELDRSAWVGGPGRYTDQRLGSFRLGEVIGRGAMGEIYAAEPEGAGEDAAIKLLHRGHLDGSSTHLHRFIREARVAATIDHPNVVRFLEVGDVDAPIPYLAMERLEGTDLAQMLRERRSLPVDEVVALVDQVAAGLEAARRAGIVHRDLKPQNLFLQRDDSWKILDFGVSKLATDTQNLTRGLVVGTPAYMAPEQASGREVDHRADVYSLAVIAYRALTGHPAFSGHRIPQVLYDVVHRMPLRPGELTALPEAVDAAMAVALTKHPEDRFERAGDLARALSDAARDQIDPALRRRADALLEHHPWNSLR